MRNRDFPPGEKMPKNKNNYEGSKLLIRRAYNDELSRLWSSVAVIYSLEEYPNDNLYLCHFGYHKCANGFVCGPGIRDLYLIHYICSGCGTFEESGNVHHLKAGDSYIIRPGEITTCRADLTDPWLHVFFAFDGEMASELIAATGFSASKILSINDDRISDTIFEALNNIEKQQNKYIFGLSLLLKLIDIYAQRHTYAGAMKHRENTYASRVKDYIDFYYSENITIESIASLFHISRNYLYSTFKMKYGISPNSYLTNKRLEFACELLAASDSPCSQVASACGFQTYSAFHRLFVQKFGMSANQYRAMHSRAGNDVKN